MIFLVPGSHRFFFKRELGRQYSLEAYESGYGRPVFPLQFGAFLRSLPKIDDTSKYLDLFVSLGRTNPIRDRFIASALDATFGRNSGMAAWIATNSDSPLISGHPFGHMLHDLLPWGRYMIHQGHSRIGASIVGFGRDCLHSWELFSFATFALYQDTGLHIPYPFKDGVHCKHITENDFSNLHDIIKLELNEPVFREIVARQGRDHCHKYHSTRARAEYLVDISMRIINGEKVDHVEFGL